MKYTSVLGGSQWVTVGSVALPAPHSLEEDDENTIIPHHIVRAPTSPINEEQEYIHRVSEEGAMEDEESSLPPPDWYFETDPIALFTPARGVKSTLVPFASSKASDTSKGKVLTYSVKEISSAASNSPPTRPERYFSFASPFEVALRKAAIITSTLSKSLSEPPFTSAKRSVTDVEETTTSTTSSSASIPSTDKTTLEPPDPRKASSKPTTKVRSRNIDGLPVPSTGGVSDAARLKGAGASGLGGIDGLPAHRRNPGALDVCPVPGSAIEAVRKYQLPSQAVRERRGVRARFAAFFHRS
ncbi:hypothetical protein D9611_011159 [Ephemerocybe angulata]|uniref:Uncharacterized protein n=1 Tax=Ephemerocybe angulata TaxID=980116 RepID=A0A8H5CC95_9AGAR|nr:hypothetical protein D9611_011159 [Tulosesus angulatus]